MLKDALDLWKESYKKFNGGTSLRMRLLIFFLVFLLAVVSGFLLIFSFTGFFSYKWSECHDWTGNELYRIAQNTYSDFGKLSIQGISFAETLSAALEKDMREQGFMPSQLAENPQNIELLLDHQMNTLLSAHRQVRASGVFLMLNATVNPDLKGAENSRAGIFLKTTEPNIINAADLSIRCLRGPSKVALSHGIQLIPQWKMEFDTETDDFFQTTIQNAEQSDLPLSRLYYWSERVLLKENSESGMLLCVPLIASDGTILGICGFEVSNMLFKLTYSPSNIHYHRVFAALSPAAGNTISPNHGLVGGNYYMTNHVLGEKMVLEKGKNGFTLYRDENADTYMGLSTEVSLYPKDSVYGDKKWLLSVMIPKEDVSSIIAAQKKKILLAFLVLFAVCLFIADFISKRYINPVLVTLNGIKNSGYASIPKTKILEIDDLLEFLTAEDAKMERKIQEANLNPKTSSPLPQEQTSFSAYTEFVKNISTLSPAEKAVFDLYMEGYSANDITEILCLSINTIKTHNRRIYTKLNVSSRKELMVYVHMMKEIDNTKPS